MVFSPHHPTPLMEMLGDMLRWRLVPVSNQVCRYIPQCLPSRNISALPAVLTAKILCQIDTAINSVTAQFIDQQRRLEFQLSVNQRNHLQ